MTLKHAWEREIVDGGAVGDGEFWWCSQCGASGGLTNGFRFSAPLVGGPPGPRTCEVYETRPAPFYSGYAGIGNLDLPENDCAESKRMIAEFKAREDYQKGRLESYIWFGGWVLKEMEKHYGVTGTVNEEGRIYAGVIQNLDYGSTGAEAIRVYHTDTVFSAVPEDTGVNDRGWALRVPGPGPQESTVTHPTYYNELIAELHAYYRANPRTNSR